MDRNSFGYFYGRESDQFSFYRVPKALVTDAEFSRLSLGAKFLYGILLDRMNLSAQNGWFDEKNRVYIIYTVEDINDALRCSKNTSVELLAELERFGLIEKRRRGFGKPNLIYVKNFITESQKLGFKNPKKSTSGIPDIGIQESQKLGPSNTDKNNTEKSNTDSIPFLSVNGTDDPPGRTEGKGNEFTARETYRQIIKDNIGYEILLSEDHVSKYILDEILDLIVDVVCTGAKHIRVSRDDKPAEVVRAQFLKLEPEHIRMVIRCLEENTTKVKNMRQYLTASLYNAPMTLDNYYRSLVNHDMHGN